MTAEEHSEVKELLGGPSQQVPIAWSGGSNFLVKMIYRVLDYAAGAANWSNKPENLKIER